MFRINSQASSHYKLLHHTVHPWLRPREGRAWQQNITVILGNLLLINQACGLKHQHLLWAQNLTFKLHQR